MKRVVAAGASPSDSFLVLGVACRKSLAHKRMRSSIAQPRIMLLGGGIEVARSGLGSSATAAKAGGGGGGMVSLGSGLSSLGGSGPVGAHSKLSSFDSMLDQEQQYLGAVVDRIASFNPDVLLVEGSVARCVPACLPAWRSSQMQPAVATIAAPCCRRNCVAQGRIVGPSHGVRNWEGVCQRLVVSVSQPALHEAPRFSLRPCCRYAQELLLARDISLVLNVKPELLERIARCTGAQVCLCVGVGGGGGVLTGPA